MLENIYYKYKRFYLTSTYDFSAQYGVVLVIVIFGFVWDYNSFSYNIYLHWKRCVFHATKKEFSIPFYIQILFSNV